MVHKGRTQLSAFLVWLLRGGLWKSAVMRKRPPQPPGSHSNDSFILFAYATGGQAADDIDFEEIKFLLHESRAGRADVVHCTCTLRWQLSHRFLVHMEAHTHRAILVAYTSFATEGVRKRRRSARTIAHEIVRNGIDVCVSSCVCADDTYWPHMFPVCNQRHFKPYSDSKPT